MHKIVTIVAFTSFLSPLAAQNPRPTKADDKDGKTAVVLGFGDPAPPLKATKWLQGTEVKSFAPGQVYVVEFWATWCVPCIVMMPHLSELHTEYKGKVTFIGFSVKDVNNSEEKVTAFVTRRGPKLGYEFAFADNPETYAAYVTAARRTSIPCSFVVGKDGKIAYVGHPMYLDLVLPKVVEGKWTKADVEELKKVEADVQGVLKTLRTLSTKPESALKALDEFDKKHPKLSYLPYLLPSRLNYLIRADKLDEARKYADGVLARAIKNEDQNALQTVAEAMHSAALLDDKAAGILCLKAAAAALKLAGDKDAYALLIVAEAHLANGDKVKAKDYAVRARAAAATETEGMKKFIEGRVKMIEEKMDD